jgi:protein involved in polysaccharide export with SLBB domain
MRSLLLTLTASLLVLINAGCETSSSNSARQFPGAASRPGASGGVIQQGDTLEVYVLEDEGFNGRYLVRSGGHIIFPRVGRVHVAGATLAGAEASIKHAFETNQLKTATVIVERNAAAAPAGGGIVVTVSGDVEEPGRKQVSGVSGRPPMLYESVLASAGLSRWANLKSVIVSRTGPNGSLERLSVDAKAISLGKIPDLPLQDGDLIHVTQRSFGF